MTGIVLWILAGGAIFFALAFILVLMHWQRATIERLRSEFSALAAAKFEERAESLSEKNARDVKPLFDALRQTIDEFRKTAESAKDANVKLGGELAVHINEVGKRAQSLGRQAEEFMVALRGGSKHQGNWGEGIVRNALEGAGLKCGTDFFEQEGAKDAGLPDFVVHDGVHRKVLIDAKVNIEAFLNAVRAADEGRPEEAEALMKAHAKDVRKQIAGLAEKRYPQKLKAKDGDAEAEYSPIVIMAMPSEATYAAALSADPQIGAFANERNIVLASPQMLFGYLVLFKMGLDRLKVDRNNQEIAKRAEQIISRMDQACSALEEIDRSLEKARGECAEAMRKLLGRDGAQSVLVPARELAKLVNATAKRRSQALQD